VNGVSFAMDLTPLLFDTSISPDTFVREMIQRFLQDVADRLLRLNQ
jgi:hypothetical protein